MKIHALLWLDHIIDKEKTCDLKRITVWLKKTDIDWKFLCFFRGKFYAWVLDKLYKNITYTSFKYFIRRRRACLFFNITTPLIVSKKGEQKKLRMLWVMLCQSSESECGPVGEGGG